MLPGYRLIETRGKKSPHSSALSAPGRESSAHGGAARHGQSRCCRAEGQSHSFTKFSGSVGCINGDVWSVGSSIVRPQPPLPHDATVPSTGAYELQPIFVENMAILRVDIGFYIGLIL